MKTSGLFDIQVNGYAGVDFNDASLTADALDHALRAMLEAGVTHCLPTVITASESVMGERLAALDRAVARSRLGRLMAPGFHLEGPFLNPATGYAGCHPATDMVAPDPELLERITRGLRRPVLVLTLAPEREGAGAVIAWARRRGAVAAIGHSAASPDIVARAAEAGATLSVHLGNGLAALQPKFANPMMAQLGDDRLSASFIADGIHIPPHALRVMVRAKGQGRGILVTDGTAAAASAAGRYGFAGVAIELGADGSVRLPGRSTLAGSALTLDQAVRNVVAWGIAAPAEALRMASANALSVLAPALEANGIALPTCEVDWTPDLRPHDVRVGEMQISPAFA